MKRVLSVFSLVLLYATLMSCTNNNPVQTQTPSEDVKEYLVEKEDYIDISQSYDGKELYYILILEKILLLRLVMTFYYRMKICDNNCRN